MSDEIAFGTIRQKGACVDLDPGQVPLIAKVRPCKAGKDSQVKIFDILHFKGTKK